MKKILSTMLMAAAFVPAMAQSSTSSETVEYNGNKHQVQTNTFWNNWFISAGVGGQIYFGDHNKQMDLGDRIAPAFDINFGKWFTPEFGLRIGVGGFKEKGLSYSYEAHTQGGKPYTGHNGAKLTEQEFPFYNLHADLMVNMSNLLLGYNPNRVWSVIPYAGVGWGRVWENPKTKEVTANIGLINKIRLSDAWDLNLDVRGMYVHDRFDGLEGKRKSDGNLSATLGLTYKFKQRGWDRSKTIIRDNTDWKTINDLKQQVLDLQAENDRLKKAIAANDKQTINQVINKVIAANLVTFTINRWELSNQARASLGLLAEAIKAGDSDAKYVVTGYADKGTGSAKRNQFLSEKRAEAVYNCLTEEFGVNPNQLIKETKGGVDNMFYDDPTVSRAVITRAAK